MANTCEECEWVHERKSHPRQWLCGKNPKAQEVNFVKPDVWVYSDPFMRCKDINRDGECPDWEQIRGQSE